ncbi:MAG: lysylphosphatidylglycerol synthase transmembrane domain-containing protein [Bacteroidaceae bacterium]
MKKIIKTVLEVIFPLILGGLILLWVYRDFDFSKLKDVALEKMNYGWMVATLFFGVTSHVIRGMRWQLALEPLDMYPKRRNCIYAIFISYAASIAIPRVGEVSRCGILKKQDQIPFAKSLGTVVTERMIDMLMVGILAFVALLWQEEVFRTFFLETGTKLESIQGIFHSVDFYIVIASVVGVLILLYRLLKTLSFFEKVKGIALNIWLGVKSLKDIPQPKLFIFYTLLIWICYFLQFYLSFFCFAFTAQLGLESALVLFVVGSIAVVVPTPNGAGPWHYAIISMMVFYGVEKGDAGIFAIIVHGIQTFLIILLGVYGLIALTFSNKIKKI